MKLNKSKWFLAAVLLVLTTTMYSCMVPANKEAYLKNFKSFVERVGKNHNDFNKKDWKWADTTFDKFSKDWYRNYKDELTTDDELEVIELKLKYQSYKQPDVIKQIYKDLVENEGTELKEKINEYIDNDMDEDVDHLIDGMKEIGDSAMKVVEDVIEKIDNRF